MAAQILDRIAAVSTGLQRPDQALQAAYDAESLRAAARPASAPPSKWYDSSKASLFFLRQLAMQECMYEMQGPSSLR